MLIIECSKIKKNYGDRLILDIDNLNIYSEDRIGVIGINGSGKTTLINILNQKTDPDEGWVKLMGKTEYISQLEEPETHEIRSEMASKFGVEILWNENMSGGEKTRFKLAKALENESMLIFADEPTSNMDIEGIELMEKKLIEYKGALIIVSHDRSFLDKLCNKIIEIENGKIKTYEGNYSDYSKQRLHDKQRTQFEYEEYIKEKKRLKSVMDDTKQKVKSIKRAPKRMGNSEARLHKMGGQKAKANLERKVGNLEKRIEHLEVKEKPKKSSKIKIDIMASDIIHSKIIIEGKKVNKSFGNKIIFKDAEFSIYNNSKVALIGPNGCGKSTLVKMIAENDNSIKLSKGAKIGYFSQDMNILINNLSIIDNVMESCIYSENFARLLLARLLFKGNDVYKKIDSALNYLSQEQNDFGNYGNSNSTSMVIIALTSLGINPNSDTGNFAKNEKSLIDGLLQFKTSTDKFGYSNNITASTMSTEQGFRALVAYNGYINSNNEYNIYIFGSQTGDGTELTSEIDPNNTSNPDALNNIKGGTGTFFIIVTRGHRYDQVCLEKIIRKENAYIGMIGSRLRVAKVLDYLEEQGVLRELLNQVYTPIGLRIGAETPAEIAVAIMAEIIQVKNKKAGLCTYNDELIEFVLDEKNNIPKSLVTIVSRKGSSPRDVGTKMIVSKDGTMVGTIGGGCVEADIRQTALSCMDHNECKLVRVDMTGEEAENDGMVCGGVVELFVEPIN